MSDYIELDGDDDVIRLLEGVAPRMAANIARSTVHAMAGEVRDEAKRLAPSDQGVLRKSIKTKRRRGRRFGEIRSDVIVSREAFYWRFLEYGTFRLKEWGFFHRALSAIRARLPGLLRKHFLQKYIAALAREQRKRQR